MSSTPTGLRQEIFMNIQTYKFYTLHETCLLGYGFYIGRFLEKKPV